MVIKMIKVEAPAKINLCLDIMSRLENGYHNVWMIMQSVDLCDYVTIEKTDSGVIELTCDNDGIPSDSRNIAWKAAEAFFDYTNIKNCGLKLHIEKNIPFAAGLAGGSTDAAAVLVGMNRIFDANLTETELCRIGTKIGADVPFCIVGGTRLALDIGQIMAELPDFEGYKAVIVKPDRSVSTKEAYESFDTSDNVRHPKNDMILNFAAKGDYKSAFNLFENVFEQFIEVPERVEIKKIMRECNAEYTLMSGSGPSVYGIFKNEQDAKECAEKCKSISESSHYCSLRNEGCRII